PPCVRESSGDLRLLHSFPTRRSSDLAGVLLDARNRRVGENLDARVAARGGHRRGDRTHAADDVAGVTLPRFLVATAQQVKQEPQDRKSTRLNSSHVKISYAVFCLKKK